MHFRPIRRSIPLPSPTADISQSTERRFLERSMWKEGIGDSELLGEEIARQRDGWLREHILVSDNGTSMGRNEEEANLAFRFSAPQGGETARVAISHTITERARRSPRLNRYLGTTSMKLRIGPSLLTGRVYFPNASASQSKRRPMSSLNRPDWER